MSDKSAIEWTEATWNPLAGCSLVSPGCKNCYAMGVANRLLDKPGTHYEGTTQRVNGKAVWTGKVNKAPDAVLMQPLKWKRPRMVFVNSMSDLFHEDVPDAWIDEIFAVMLACPHHTFQILTKRPERMMEYCNTLGKHHSTDRVSIAAKALGARTNGKISGFYKLVPGGWALPNVWLGVTVEDQRRAGERIRALLNTPAAVRFLSMEPLIDAVDLNNLFSPAKKDPDRVPLVAETCLYTVADRPAILPMHDQNKIDWVILGGESGPDARPMHPDWARFTRDQCNAAKVPFFFKQWGRWAPLLPEHEGRRDWAIVDHGGGVDIPDDRWPDETLGEVAMVAVGKKAAGRMLDGRTWDEMPKGGLL